MAHTCLHTYMHTHTHTHRTLKCIHDHGVHWGQQWKVKHCQVNFIFCVQWPITLSHIINLCTEVYTYVCVWHVLESFEGFTAVCPRILTPIDMVSYPRRMKDIKLVGRQVLRPYFFSIFEMLIWEFSYLMFQKLCVFT